MQGTRIPDECMAAGRSIDLEVQEEGSGLRIGQHPSQAVGRSVQVHEVVVHLRRIMVLEDVGVAWRAW